MSHIQDRIERNLKAHKKTPKKSEKSHEKWYKNIWKCKKTSEIETKLVLIFKSHIFRFVLHMNPHPILHLP